MPQIYWDTPGNFEHSQSSVTLVYNVVADAGEQLLSTDVRAMIIGRGDGGGAAPDEYTPDGQQVVWPIRGYRQQEIQPGIWKCSVTYSPLNYQYAFELAGSDQTVYQSKQTIHVYPDHYATPDFKGAMNVDENGVHGASIFVPTSNWSETLEVPAKEVDAVYRKKIYDLIGCTNKEDFRLLEAGSVLFRGCSGAISTANPLYYTLTYKFAYEPNRSEANKNMLKVGTIDNIEKKGWEYLWVRYKKNPSTNPPTLVHEPEYVFIEKVYEEGDYKNLNIGTGTKIGWGL